MNKFDPNKLPHAAQIWTDADLAKWAGFAFVAGIIIGAVLTWHY
jgi:hypothetical protein